MQRFRQQTSAITLAAMVVAGLLLSVRAGAGTTKVIYPVSAGGQWHPCGWHDCLDDFDGQIGQGNPQDDRMMVAAAAGGGEQHSVEFWYPGVDTNGLDALEQTDVVVSATLMFNYREQLNPWAMRLLQHGHNQ